MLWAHTDLSMYSQSLKQILSLTMFVGAALFVWGCFEGAPHSNPLDPRSENFENSGAITGTVTGFYPPFAGLERVEVRLSPGDRLTHSNANGQFDFPDVEPGRYTVIAQRPGYATAADTIDVNLNEQTSVALRLNGIPFLVDADLRTFHLSRWWPPPQDQYWLDISIQASDPDGVADVEAVFLEIPVVDLVDTLQFEQGRYIVQLRENDIGQSVRAIAGHNINIIIRDQAGEESVFQGQRASRFIVENPVAESPSEYGTASSNPPLYTWSLAQANFPYTYLVEINEVNANITTLVQTITNIPSDSLSVTGIDPLPIGQYSWTVTIVDEFGNRSRSREATFFIR